MNQSSEISSKLWEEREDALRQDIREMLELELNRQKKRDRATEERHKKLQYYYRNKRTIYEQSLKELNDRKEAIRMIKKQIVLQQNMMHRLVFKVTLGGDDITELLYSTKETSIGVQGSEKVDETEAADMNSSDVGQIKFSQSCIPFTSIAEDIVEMVFDKLVEILQNDQPLIQDVHSAASDGMLNELCENLTSETIIQDLIDSVIFKLKDCIKMDFCLSYDG
ncbi:uncharacterized protein LOC143525115 isoform X3 [Brachyhypopomus gauderio]|uniref:uncharacterized protein LOC143525115 isoform X3 n=1 Tax=Brachyhypopomus gauderio TaxID=698409 RepID=UPI00404382D5